MKKKSVDSDFRAKYKTEICKFWGLNKECRYGDNVRFLFIECAFAHGNSDMRTKNFVASNYKTKKCKQFFDAGYCPYGSRCQFKHAEG
jgi:butyrate response factor 1